MPAQVCARSLSSELCFVALLISVTFLPAEALSPPTIALSKKTGPPTSRILVSGKGFAPNVAVDVYFDTHDERLVVTDNNGEFRSAAISPPHEAKPGKHWVSAVQRNDGQAAQRAFVVETDWTEGRYDAANSGFNSYENVLNPESVADLGLKWSFASGGDTTPTVANGAIYFANSGGHVYALNARTGQMLWQYIDADGSVFSSPAVVDGVVYFGGYDDVTALNAKTGTVIWDQRETDGQGIFALTVTNGVIYFSTGGGFVYALDTKDGSKIWSYYAGPHHLLSAPAVANGVTYIASGDLLALDATTGELLWSYPIGNPENDDIESSPSVSNGIVYVGSLSGVYAVDISTTALLWSYTMAEPIPGSLAVGSRAVYASSSDGNVYAFDAYSGMVLWKYANPSLSPAVANGVVYLGGPNVSALDGGSGHLLWEYGTDDSWEPSVANGTLYVSDQDNMYAFGLKHGDSDEALSAPPDPKTLLPNVQLGNLATEQQRR